MLKKMTCLLMLVAVLALSSTGCYGPFRLTKKLHKFNGEIKDKWAREGVFLVLVIVPVYGFSLLADGIIFNSIEFWTGKNPVESAALDRGHERTVGRGPRKTVLRYEPVTGRLDVAAYEGGRVVRSGRVEPLPEGGMALRSETGELVMVSRSTEDGGVSVESASGRVLARHSAQEAERLLSSR